MKRLWVRILVILSVIGPGLIAGTANNDAGGISTYSFAGSKFGYALLWVLTVNFLTLAVTQEIGVRLGVFTGKGLASLIRERFKVRWTLVAVLTLFLANLAVCTSEFAGLAASLEIFSFSRYYTVPILAVVIWFVLYKGSFKKVERFFLLISLFFLVYVVSAVMSHPDWGGVVKGAITPYVSLEPVYFLTLLGIMGTTITPWGQFFIQSYVVDKGIVEKNYRIERAEVYISAFFTCLIAAMIMITTKDVLFDHGIVVDSAETAALSLQPILGKLAEMIFAIGFFCASLLGAFILPLTTSYCICEALGFEHGMDKKIKEAPFFYGLIGAIIILSSIFVLTSIIPLFRVMLFAQVLNGMLLPIILIFLVILFNDKKRELGTPRASRVGRIFYQVVTWEAIVRLTFISALLILFTLAPSLLEKLKQLVG